MIHRAQPTTTSVNGQEAEWSFDIMAKWAVRVVATLVDDEWIDRANYFTPRKQKDRYNKGNPHEGFVYVLMPGHHVCTKEWIP